MPLLQDMFAEDGSRLAIPRDRMIGAQLEHAGDFLPVMEGNGAMLGALGYQPGPRESPNVVLASPETQTTLPERLMVFLRNLPAAAFSRETPEQIMRAMPRHWPKGR